MGIRNCLVSRELPMNDKSGDSRSLLKRLMLPALLQKHSIDVLEMSSFFMQPFLKFSLSRFFGAQLYSLKCLACWVDKREVHNVGHCHTIGSLPSLWDPVSDSLGFHPCTIVQYVHRVVTCERTIYTP